MAINIREKERPPSIDYDTVKDWLDHQTTHTIHTAPPNKYPTEAIVVDYMDMQ